MTSKIRQLLENIVEKTCNNCLPFCQEDSDDESLSPGEPGNFASVLPGPEDD